MTQPDLAQQTRQQRFVDLFVFAVFPTQVQAILTRFITQLLVQIEPFQDALPVQEFPAAEFPELVASTVFSLLTKVPPEVEKRDEIRLGVVEPIV
jgi:hypothetical protein